jgi:signal transduction histidine kinase
MFGDIWYMPHGHCYLWQPPLVWMHVVSDFLIGAAYFFISLTLYFLVRRIRLPFSGMILAFGVFIGACGLTHFMEVWNVWEAHYWLAGGVKVVTAVASVLTGAYLVPLRGQVAELASAARLSEERRTQLESKNKELEVLYARVKESEDLKSQFFANLSHELRTPLALILGPVEKLLDGGALTDTQRRDLETVSRNAELLLKHVNDLLDASKLEAGKLSAQYSQGDLALLLRRTCGFFASFATDRQVALIVQTPESLPGPFDVEKLQRVVLNLLSNAFKFVPPGGQVRTTLDRRDGCALLSVEDSGPGVKPELRDAIFERFRQAEGGATRRFGGTGLGLSIARDFVALHGGRIFVEDSPLGGARFTVELPLTPPEGVAIQPLPVTAEAAMLERAAREGLETLHEPSAAAVPASPANPSHLALVVEDNVEMRRFISDTLGTDMRVMTADNGREGLEKVRALRPDVLVTDMMMPEMSGDQLLRAVRADSQLEDLPIILLTARGDDALKVALLREGAQDYLTKPFHPEELRVRVHNLVVMKRVRDTLRQDVTARTSDVEELAREVTLRQRQLEAALAATTLAREQAEQASLAKSTFLRLVSHELRTPLTAIQLHLQLLGKSRDPAAALEKFSRSFKRLTELVESVLEYTRIESGQLVVKRERLDVVGLAHEVVEELLPQAQQKLLRLELLPAPAVPELESDPRLIRLILINLVVNAVKYTERGSVQVAVGHGAEGHWLSVQDTGPGIPEEVRERIFQPFEQLESITHKHTPGMGLGLALVRELVAVLGGRIRVESTVGQGSTFTVVLPAPGERQELNPA